MMGSKWNYYWMLRTYGNRTAKRPKYRHKSQSKQSTGNEGNNNTFIGILNAHLNLYKNLLYITLVYDQ